MTNRMKITPQTLATSFIVVLAIATCAQAQTLFPSDQATMVNPDVQLKLTFKDVPRIGKSGKIRIYDASDDRLVDTLDMSIPPGPTKPVDPAVRAKDYLAFPYPYDRNHDRQIATQNQEHHPPGAVPTSNEYQLTIIGGFTDGFHFYPITVDGNDRDDSSASRPARIREDLLCPDRRRS